jgi:hypothetical protein
MLRFGIRMLGYNSFLEALEAYAFTRRWGLLYFLNTSRPFAYNQLT